MTRHEPLGGSEDAEGPSDVSHDGTGTDHSYEQAVARAMATQVPRLRTSSLHLIAVCRAHHDCNRYSCKGVAHLIAVPHRHWGH